MVLSAAFSPDGRELAVVTLAGGLSVFDTTTWKQTQSVPGVESRAFAYGYYGATLLAFSPVGHRLALTSDRRTIKVYDAATWKEKFALRGHLAEVSCLAYSADGRRLASASYDGTVKVWDTFAGQEALNIGKKVLAFSPDGRRLVSTSGDKTALVLDAITGQDTFSLRGHTAAVESAAYSPDGLYIVTASMDQTIKVWDAATGNEIRGLRGHKEVVKSVAFSPDGRHVASASKDQMVKIWDVAKGQEVFTFQGHTASVYEVVFSPDGKRLASTSGDGTVKVWDVVTGREALTLQVHKGLEINLVSLNEYWGVAFSPDGLRLAAGCWDRTIKIWDAVTGQEVATFVGHKATITDVAFSPDGRRLASASDQIKIWDVATGQDLLSLQGNQPLNLAFDGRVKFSPDGLRLAYTVGYNSTIWDATPVTEDSYVQREATSIVEFLFGKPLLREEVLPVIRQDQTIAEPLRNVALVLAEKWPEDQAALIQASREIVRSANASAERYNQALRHAKAVCRPESENGYLLTTLGIAQYRARRYQEALETLTRSEKFNSKDQKGSQPGDLAFLAMAQQRLGKNAEARATLVRLSQAMKDPAVAGNQEYEAFQREAEALLQEKNAPDPAPERNPRP